MGFLYKKLSEKDKEEIKKEAKRIMDSFGKKLSKIKELPKEGSIKRENSIREEGPGKDGSPDFKKRIYSKELY